MLVVFRLTGDWQRLTVLRVIFVVSGVVLRGLRAVTGRALPLRVVVILSGAAIAARCRRRHIAAEIVVSRVVLRVLPLIVLRATQLIAQAIVLLTLLRQLLELGQSIILRSGRLAAVTRATGRRLKSWLVITAMLRGLMSALLLMVIQITLKLRCERDRRMPSLTALMLCTEERRLLILLSWMRLLMRVRILLRIMIGGVLSITLRMLLAVMVRRRVLAIAVSAALLRRHRGPLIGLRCCIARVRWRIRLCRSLPIPRRLRSSAVHRTVRT